MMDGRLYLCVEYWDFNQAIVKNRYPLPLISELLDRLSGAQIFSNLDLRSADDLILIIQHDK